MHATANEIKFTDADVVNPDDFIPAGEFNPHNVRPWLLHDHGFVLAVVFADCLGDAIDEAVDAGKMELYFVDLKDKSDDADWHDYGDTIQEALDDESLSFLGNDGVCCDIETLSVVELTNPPFSFMALYNSQG